MTLYVPQKPKQRQTPLYSTKPLLKSTPASLSTWRPSMRFVLFTGIKSAQWQSLLIALIVLSLTACAPKSMPLRPTMPPLPAQVTQPCALPSPLPDGQISTLISALMDAWEAQSACEIRRAGAVEAYEAARKANQGE